MSFQGMGDQVTFKDLRGRITVEYLSPFQLLVPPGIADPAHFTWEVVVSARSVECVVTEWPQADGIKPQRLASIDMLGLRDVSRVRDDLGHVGARVGHGPAGRARRAPAGLHRLREALAAVPAGPHGRDGRRRIPGARGTARAALPRRPGRPPLRPHLRPLLDGAEPLLGPRPDRGRDRDPTHLQPAADADVAGDRPRHALRPRRGGRPGRRGPEGFADGAREAEPGPQAAAAGGGDGAGPVDGAGAAGDPEGPRVGDGDPGRQPGREPLRGRHLFAAWRCCARRICRRCRSRSRTSSRPPARSPTTCCTT